MTGGLCISPGFIPDKVGTANLNPDYYRSILYTLDGVDDLIRTGRPLIITLNNQCAEVGPRYGRWKSAVKSLMERAAPHIKVFGCGNELDLYWAQNNNDVPPEFAAKLANDAAEICHEYGVAVAPTSLAGPAWPQYLEEMAPLCRDNVDYFDIHPYGKKPAMWKRGEDWMFGTLEDMVITVKAATGKPVIATEYGVKIGDAGSEEEVAAFLYEANKSMERLEVPYWAWFAWHDLVGGPDERGSAAFGLLDAEHNRRRPAWHVFRDIHGGGVEVDNLIEWRGKVGDGLLNMMRQDQTEPAMASEWRPFDRDKGSPAKIEQTVGINGTTYMWLLDQNQGFRIPAGSS